MSIFLRSRRHLQDNIVCQSISNMCDNYLLHLCLVFGYVLATKTIWFELWKNRCILPFIIIHPQESMCQESKVVFLFFLFLNDQEDSLEIPEEKEKLTIFWLRTNQSVIHNHEYTSLVEFDG